MHDEIEAVLLPGLDGTGHLLQHFAAQAPSRFKPIVLSYPLNRKLNYHELEHELAPRLRSHRRLIVIAESFGGPLAIRLAARTDLSIRAIVLCNSFVSAPLPSFLRHFVWSPLFRIKMPNFLLARFMLAPFATEELTHEFSRVIAGVPAKVVSGRLRDLLMVDERETLQRKVAQPLLYLRGTHDHLVPMRAMNEVVKAAPHAVVARIAAPHALLQTAGAAAWAEIERFFASSAV